MVSIFGDDFKEQVRQRPEFKVVEQILAPCLANGQRDQLVMDCDHLLGLYAKMFHAKSVLEGKQENPGTSQAQIDAREHYDKHADEIVSRISVLKGRYSEEIVSTCILQVAIAAHEQAHCMGLISKQQAHPSCVYAPGI